MLFTKFTQKKEKEASKPYSEKVIDLCINSTSQRKNNSNTTSSLCHPKLIQDWNLLLILFNTEKEERRLNYR